MAEVQEDRETDLLFFLLFEQGLVLGVEFAHFGGVFRMLPEGLLQLGNLHLLLHLADEFGFLNLLGFLFKISLHGNDFDGFTKLTVILRNSRQFIHGLQYGCQVWRLLAVRYIFPHKFDNILPGGRRHCCGREYVYR